MLSLQSIGVVIAFVWLDLYAQNAMPNVRRSIPGPGGQLRRACELPEYDNFEAAKLSPAV